VVVPPPGGPGGGGGGGGGGGVAGLLLCYCVLVFNITGTPLGGSMCVCVGNGEQGEGGTRSWSCRSSRRRHRFEHQAVPGALILQLQNMQCMRPKGVGEGGGGGAAAECPQDYALCHPLHRDIKVPLTPLQVDGTTGSCILSGCRLHYCSSAENQGGLGGTQYKGLL